VISRKSANKHKKHASREEVNIMYIMLNSYSKTILFTSLIALLSMSCKNMRCDSTSSGALVVTLPPIKYLVHEITGDDFPIEVMLPAGASPETYEPVPQQLIAAEKAQLIFTTGLLDFENALVAKLDQGATLSENRIINLSTGMELLAGDCDHEHRGIDPHIWMSPPRLAIMAKNIYCAISRLYPDSTKYTANYTKLIDDISTLNSSIMSELRKSDVRCFIIYHPALTYYANDYGLTQISIEQEGKEPSASKLKALIIKAKEENIDKVFYQSQFSQAVVRSVATEIGARIVEIDPLKEDILTNLSDITCMIAGK